MKINNALSRIKLYTVLLAIDINIPFSIIIKIIVGIILYTLVLKEVNRLTVEDNRKLDKISDKALKVLRITSVIVIVTIVLFNVFNYSNIRNKYIKESNNDIFKYNSAAIQRLVYDIDSTVDIIKIQFNNDEESIKDYNVRYSKQDNTEIAYSIQDCKKYIADGKIGKLLLRMYRVYSRIKWTFIWVQLTGLSYLLVFANTKYNLSVRKIRKAI